MIRVCAWNVEGVQISDRDERARRIGAACRRLGVDLLLAQEVGFVVNDMKRGIKKAGGFEWGWWPYLGFPIRPGLCTFGMGQKPIERRKAAYQTPPGPAKGDLLTWKGWSACLAYGIWWVNTHLDSGGGALDQRARAGQAVELAQAVRALPGHVALGGDLNLEASPDRHRVQDRATYEALARATGLRTAIHYDLDAILVSSGVRALEARVVSDEELGDVARDLSDHRPLLAVLD